MDVTRTDDPPVLDTYALVYAFGLLLLIPGLMLASNSGYKSYSALYLASIATPFALALAATLATDSADPLKTRLLRFAVLLPLVTMTGVAVMFGASIALVPVSRWIRVENFSVLSWISMVLLAVVLVPLLVTAIRRVTHLRGSRDVLHVLVLAAALALAVVVGVILTRYDGVLGEYLRKDMLIYLVGALTWYLPSFSLSAGVWRRLGLV